MTTERFRVHELVKYNYSEIGEYIDENHTDRPLRNDILVELLNELYEENKELKAKVDDKEVAVEVECEKLMQKVFDLIDKSLEKDKQYYEMTYEDYLNGRIEVLEDLKKELLDD